MIVAKFTASSLGITLDAPSNTKEVEVSFYNLIASDVRSSLISETPDAQAILDEMREQVKAIESAAWAKVEALLEPKAEATVLGYLVGIDAIAAGSKVYTLLEAVNRLFDLFKAGKNANFEVAPKSWASYEVTVKNGTATRWLPANDVEELEAIRAALPAGFAGMSIAMQRTLASKAMRYNAAGTKTIEV